eukprot:PhF_6_TR16986/c0_g1_i2/m.25690
MRDWSENGHHYSGEWSHDGIMHGTGTYTWEETGSSYTGQWHRGKPHGEGCLVTHKGQRSYVGRFCNGKKHGAGVCTYRPNGAVYYRGSFEEDLRCGYGEFTDQNVTSCGIWRNDKLCTDKDWVQWLGDEGKYTRQGDKEITATQYETWRCERIREAGEMFPESRATELRSGASYIGDYRGVALPPTKEKKPQHPQYRPVNIVPHGSGGWRHVDGSYYEGQFLNGAFHGLGFYVYHNGSMYMGSFVEGKKHGFGIYLYPSGDLYLGEYVKDVKHSERAVYFHAHTIEHALWSFKEGRQEQQKVILTNDAAAMYLKARNVQESLAPFLRFLPATKSVIKAFALYAPIVFDCSRAAGNEAGATCVSIIPRTVLPVLHGCLHNLVAYLVCEYVRDGYFRNVFLTTFKLFTSYEELLYILSGHYEKESMWSVIKTIAYEHKGITEDFGGGTSASLLFNFAAAVPKTKAASAKIAQEVVTAVKNARLMEGNKQEDGLSPLSQVLLHVNEGDDEVEDHRLLCDAFSVEEFANVVTEFERYEMYRLTTDDLLQSTSDPQISSRFNRSTKRIVESVLKAPTIEDRARQFTYWVNLANLLLTDKYLNFHWFFLVSSAITSHYISRLKHTLKKIDEETKSQLTRFESLINPIGNFKDARELMVAARDKNKPTVPYIGVVMRDIILARDGNPTWLRGGVNWSKMTILYETLKAFQCNFGTTTCIPPSVVGEHKECALHLMTTWWNPTKMDENLKIPSDDELYELSVSVAELEEGEVLVE